MKRSILALAGAALLAAGAMAVPAERGTLSPDGRFTVSDALTPNTSLAVPQKAATRAGTYTMGYCGEPADGGLYLTNAQLNKSIVYIGQEFRASDLRSLVGSKIVGIKIASPTNNNGGNPCVNISAWLTKDLKERITQVDAKLSTTAHAWNTIMFETPYEIPENPESIYGGFYFRVPASECYYIVVDGMPTPETVNNGIAGLGTGKAFPANFADGGGFSSMYGSICIQLIIEGDNLPVDMATPSAIELPQIKPGEKSEYKLTVANRGSNAIESVTIETALTNATSTQEIKLDKALENGMNTVITVPFTSETAYLGNLTSTITKVNGKDNVYSVKSTSAILTCYAEGFKRVTVMEDATGTWCMWCPYAIVLTEMANENYPDRIIPIAVHYNDQMACQSYSDWYTAMQFTGSVPYYIFNRMISGGAYRNYYDKMGKYLDDVMALFGDESYCKVEFAEAAGSGNNNEIYVETNTTFSVNTEIPHNITYVVLEDNVGPYTQQNAYAGGANGKMGGFENKDQEIKGYMYNDVARYIDKYPGNSFPNKIEANNPLNSWENIAVKNVKGDDMRVVAIVTNAITGEIVNAAQKSLKKSGVQNVIDSENAVSVYGGNGEVIVKGADNAEVYTLDGRRASTTGLASGLYIVRAAGKTFKVMVK